MAKVDANTIKRLIATTITSASAGDVTVQPNSTGLLTTYNHCMNVTSKTGTDTLIDSAQDARWERR